MTDYLDQLSDAELNEVFAREVAGWSDHPMCSKQAYGPDGLSCYWSDAPPFATSADAVLPFLQGLPNGCEITWWPSGAWSVQFYVPGKHPGTCFKSECEAAETLPRAACIALIKAKRAEKEGV